MQLQQLSPRIYYLPPSQETDRPTLGYVRGDKAALMVDAGNSAAHAALFQDALQQKNLPAPDYAAITHWHWDHTFGMHALAATTIAGRQTNQKLREVTRWEWTDEAMANRLRTGEDIAFCDTCIRLEYPDRGKITVVTAGMELEGVLTLDLGGVHCRLMTVDSPHSSDAMLVFVPEEKTLFLGDADGADYYHNQGRYDKQKLLAFIRLLSGIEFDIAILGHDMPQSKAEVMAYLHEELAGQDGK